MLRKSFFPLIIAAAFLLIAGSAMAATSVSWLTPANGSTYNAGTVLGATQPDGPITGQASGSGTTGGTGLDLMLVIDTSASMGSASDPNSKISAAKNAAIALINSLPDNTTQVGIVTFDVGANTYRNLQDLTSNKASLVTAVNALTAPGAATAIGDGINAATAQLTGANAITGHAKMQVVLSDGYNNYGANPITAANAAAVAGITIHTVGVPGHNVATMQAIATATGGTYNNVTDLTTLTGIFDGTSGNLVALDYVDIQLADGTWIYKIATDGLGNFTLPDKVIALGPNTFTAYAYGTDKTNAIATLTLNGTGGAAPVPEPATMLLLGTGLAGIIVMKRRKKN